MNRNYERINSLCIQNGTSVTAMCRDLHITRSVLSELKADRTKQLSHSHLAAIARYFETDIETLIGDSKEDRQIPEALSGILQRANALEPEKQAKFYKMLANLANDVLSLMK